MIKIIKTLIIASVIVFVFSNFFTLAQAAVSSRFKSGSLVRDPAGHVFVIKNGKRIRVKNLAELKKFAGRKIYNISNANMNLIPEATAANTQNTSGVNLKKVKGNIISIPPSPVTIAPGIPSGNQISYSGLIQAVNSNVIIVHPTLSRSGAAVITDSSTVFKLNGQTAKISDLKVGQNAKVTGQWDTTGGNIIAKIVEITTN